MRYALILLLFLPATAWGASATLYPTGEGATANWSNNQCTNSWECLDEAVSDSGANPDGAPLTTFIYASAANTIHQITFGDPAYGDISVCSVFVHFGYTTGPARQVEFSVDTGNGYTSMGVHDIGAGWARDTVVFSSPDSLHIANLALQVELLEATKSGHSMLWSWAQARYTYTSGAADEYEGTVILIGMKD